MKNIIVNYKVFSEKICNKNLVVLTDLHDYAWKRNNEFIDDLLEIESDLILIPGDLMKAKKYSKGSLSHYYLKDFLRIISEKSPVFLGLGNHDLYKSTMETFLGYKDLEKAREGQVFALNNETIEYGDFRITEVHPRHSAFSPSVQENGKGLLEFYEDYENIGFDIPENDELYNIMMCHNPKFFAQARSIGEQLRFNLSKEEFDNLFAFTNKMSRYDLVVSGHLHNGYIPVSKTVENPSKYMDEGYWEMPVEKSDDSKKTFIRPWIFKKTDMCRGTIFVGGTDLSVIQLCNGKYYIKNKAKNTIDETTEEKALSTISTLKMVPVVISGGVNKFFNLPIDNSEITQVKILKK